MKAILIAAFAVVSAVPAYAQSQCGPHDEFARLLEEKYGETRQVYGLNAGGEMLTEVFANTDSGTWSVLVTRPNGTACMVASGDNFARADPVPEGEPA